MVSVDAGELGAADHDARGDFRAAPTAPALLLKIVMAPVPSARAKRPEVDAALDAVLRRGGATRQGARYPSAEAFHEALAPS